MFNLPKRVKVGALTFKVKIVDVLPTEALEEKIGDALGRTAFDKQVIYICKCTKETMFNSFLHELFHTFNSEFRNEELIQNFADGLQRLIVDNPSIFKKK